ncbi:MAG: TlpA family protein disulfide reductase [Acidimicrobiia bacterium]|nr:TlpA family protein disulfide reductase [Acidimicrobiia bacterium]MYC57665.1 TlpA family protein disulfide reductase [Acidimicrobiia bacterium]MYG93570.1 TlpA family protein disulfide reductase [Acidimicrobiia bacterium]MYI31213.1 TlpA family protein disulfide reductase [Acidimicrobiia bacterium]
MLKWRCWHTLTRHITAKTSLLWAVVIVIVVSSCGSGTDDDVHPTDIAFELLSGGTATLSDYLDRPLVLNFFASWCAPCRAEMPAFEAQHLQNPTIAFLGLAVNDTKTLARELVAETGVTYPTAIDTNSAISNAFKLINMPTTLYLERDGRVIHRHSGGLTVQQIADQINTFL